MSNLRLSAKKRLERFGAEDSQTNRKLRLAALMLAHAICEYFPKPDLLTMSCFVYRLSRGYQITRIWTPGTKDEAHFVFFYGDFNLQAKWVFGEIGIVGPSIDAVDRVAAQHIASDVADGWLKEVASDIGRLRRGGCEKYAAQKKFIQEFRL